MDTGAQVYRLALIPLASSFSFLNYCSLGLKMISVL